MFPAQSKLWSSIGPFPAQDVTKAYATVFEPEKDIKNEPLDLKKSLQQARAPARAQGRRRETSAGRHAGQAGRGHEPAKKEPPTKDSTQPGPPIMPAEVRVMENPPRRKSSRRREEAGGRGGRRGFRSPSRQASRAPKRGKRTAERRRASGETRPAATKDDKTEPKPEATMARTKEAKKAEPAKPKPEKITWTEQRKWRDATPARLQGANSAYYLTRKITSTRPRTAMVQIDGPAGFRVWINGELAQTSLPPPPPAPPKQRRQVNCRGNRPGRKGRREAGRRQGRASPSRNQRHDFDGMMGRGRDNPEKKFRIGLRQGENEIVVKAVFGAGERAPGGSVAAAGVEMGGRAERRRSAAAARSPSISRRKATTS